MIDNIEVYQEVKNDPVVIYLENCPDVYDPPVIGFAADNDMSSALDVEAASLIFPETRVPEITKVISFTKDELECLIEKADEILEKAEEGEYVEFPLYICEEDI